MQTLTDRRNYFQETARRFAQYWIEYIEINQTAYDRLGLDENHIWSAMQIASEQEMRQTFIRGSRAMHSYLLVKGEYETDKRNLQKALQAIDINGTHNEEMTILYCLAGISERLGEYDQAEAYAHRGLLLATNWQHSRGKVDFWEVVSGVAIRRGDYDRAESLIRQALPVARELGDLARLLAVLQNLAVVVSKRNAIEAVPIYQEGLEAARQLGDQSKIIQFLSNLGSNAFHRGEFSQADAYFEEALHTAREISHRERICTLTQNLGAMALRRGELDVAEQKLLEAEKIAREIGEQDRLSYILHNLGVLESQRGRFEAADTYLNEALAIVRGMGQRHRVAAVLSVMGTSTRERFDHACAEKLLSESLDLSRQLNDVWMIVSVSVELGHLYLQMEQLDVASVNYDRVISLTKQHPIKDQTAEAHFGLAQIALAQGDKTDAIRLAQESLTALEAMKHRKTNEVANWLERLMNVENSAA